MEKIIIAHYMGAYGPTVRIDVHTMQWLVALKDIIAKLADGIIDKIDFCQLENAEISDINTFVLKKSDKNACSEIAFSDNENGFDIKWSENVSQLNLISGLIDGLINADSSGHQYLADEENGLLVELAYKECDR